MLIITNKITVRSGHLNKVIPFIHENASIGLNQTGCLEGYVAKCCENDNEILVFSKWQNEHDYELAKKELKKDSRIKKLAIQLLPYVSKHETVQYEIISL